MILDINLPDGDGFSLFRTLHSMADIPALFLSARDADADRLFGLGLGADDYLTKPFLTQELLLRIQRICSAAIGTNCGGLLQKRSSWASARCIWPMLWSACRMAPPSP